MGLDIGGGSGRCLMADAASGETWSAARSWSFPAADVPLGYDADLEAIWSALCSTSREVVEACAAKPQEIAAVAVTSMRFGMVLCDAEGEALYAGPNKDARAAGESIRLAVAHGEALTPRTGHWPLAIMPGPRLQWLAANASEAYARAHAVLSLNDAFTHRMCGAFATDWSQAGESGLFDLASHEWATDWIETLELDPAHFPAAYPAGARLGALSERAAAELGLRVGLPVGLGGADTQCGLLGVGAVEDGDAAIIAGTTAPVEIVLDQPTVDPSFRLWTGCHVVPDRWVMESNAGPTGDTLDWAAGLLYPGLQRPVAALLGEAATSPPGAAGLQSTLGAVVMNARAPGLPMGALSASHLMAGGDPERRRHLARAVVEGLAYSLRANLEQVAAASGRRPERVRLGGGMSASPSFSQLLADVLGVEVMAGEVSEATALGAAVCAGIAAGSFDSLANGARHLVTRFRTHTPDPGRTAAYEPLYEAWQSWRTAGAEAAAVAVTHALGALAPGAVAAPAHDDAPPLRILVTAQMDEQSLASLGELGDVEYASYREAKRLLQKESLVEALAGYDVFVTEIDLVDADSARQLPSLRIVASARGNAVNVDTEACSLLGIPVLNAPGRNADAVADLTLAFLLMLSRKLPDASRVLRESDAVAGDMRGLGNAFTTLRGQELWDKTIGLVGLGAVGRGVARRLQGFGARVLAFDPFVSDETAAVLDVASVSLEELLSASDFISLHAPVNEQTRGMIGAEQLALAKPGARLVNTARAALLDEEALVAALESGGLGGAALDVFAVEPPGADHPLLALPNVIATPHVGGNTDEVAIHQGRIIAEDLTRLLRDGAPRFALNPETARALDLSRPRPSPDAAAEARLDELAAGPGPSVTS